MKSGLALSIAFMLSACGLFSVAGTDDVQDTGAVAAGVVANPDGSLSPSVALSLIPEQRDPKSARPLPTRWLTTTDSAGAFRIDSVPEGRYNLEGRQPATGERVLLRLTQAGKDRALGGLRGLLAKPGFLVMPLEGLGAKAGDYLFLPGTTHYKVITEVELTAGQAVLDSVPAGVYPELDFAREGGGEAKSVTGGAIVLPAGESILVNAGSAWDYSRTIRVNTSASGADIQERIPGYPLLIRLASPSFDFSKATGDGRDIRCVKADGGLLPLEIQAWDSAAGKAELWVRVDTLPAGDSAFALRILAGNRSVASASNGQAVFPSADGFSQVWHLAKDGADSYVNATGNGNAMKPGHAPLAMDVNGPTGNAAMLNGTDQFLAAPTRLNAPQAYAVSLWFKTSSSQGARLISFGDSLPETASFNTDRFLWLADDGSLHFGNWDGNASLPSQDRIHILSAPGIYNDSKWHFAAAAVSAQGTRLFVDGVKVAEVSDIKSGLLKDYTGFWSLGHFVKLTEEWSPMPSGRYFSGSLEEARVLGADVSPDRIKMDYASQKPGTQVVRFP